MSHVATIEIEIKNLSALIEAAKRLGLEFNSHQKTYRWFGSHVGDYPLPAGITADMLGKCDHAISVKDSTTAYEIGVVQNRTGKPGYTLLWDFWANGKGLVEKIVSGAGLELSRENCTPAKAVGILKQYYGITAASQTARARGFNVREMRMPNGTIKLTATKG